MLKKLNDDENEKNRDGLRWAEPEPKFLKIFWIFFEKIMNIEHWSKCKTYGRNKSRITLIWVSNLILRRKNQQFLILHKKCLAVSMSSWSLTCYAYKCVCNLTRRYVKYRPTSLEKNHKYEIQTEHDLDIPIDLIDPLAYATPLPHMSPGHAALHPDDEKLLEDDSHTPQVGVCCA